MTRLLRRIESVVPRKAAAYGAKACNLAALARAGFPVPAAYAMSGTVSQDVLHQALPPRDRLAALLQEPPRSLGAERLMGIAERVRHLALPSPVERELRAAMRALRRAGAKSLAVRSSCTSEDMEAASAAGMHATILNVPDEDALLQAVRECWSSLFRRPVLHYLQAVPGAADASMGVIVQAMVPADVSGVLFTVNPLTGDPTEIVVNAAYGLGSSVVDGRVSPDTYRVDKGSGAIRDRVLGDKALQVVLDPESGVRDQVTPESDRQHWALNGASLGELVSIARRVEDRFDGPQDVEWAIVDRTVYVLQARPVTTGRVTRSRSGSARSHVERSRIVWSNVNVGEALPGPATPLTWSVLSAFSDLGFRRAFDALGCRVPKDAELVGSFRGRIYLNLSELSAILSQVPGLRPSAVLSLGGGGEVVRLESELQRRSSWWFLARFPATLARFVRENYRLERRVGQFERHFDEERARYRSVDLRVLSPQGLSKTLRDVERLLDDAGAILLSCYGNVLASMVALRATLRLLDGPRAAKLEAALLGGLDHVESAAPGLAIWRVAELARAEEEARRVLCAGEPGDLALSDLPDGPTRRALADFFDAYGHRGPREAEIAAPRFREDPTLLFAALRAHLDGGDGSRTPASVEARQRAIREEATVDLRGLVPAPARPAVTRLLSLCQQLLRVREQLRARVTEVLAMMREVAQDVSRRLEAREPDCGSDAAFFLTLDELHAVLRGKRATVSMTVRQRRRQWEREQSLPDPPDTFVGFPPEVAVEVPPADRLRGLGASAGVIEGLARVLHTPADAGTLRRGEILVTSSADVGWSPLFTVAGAIVTDLGGPLSHASVVAREYGLPAVVNVKHGSSVIRTGDRLRVDGTAGTVHVLSED